MSQCNQSNTTGITYHVYFVMETQLTPYTLCVANIVRNLRTYA